METNQGDGAAGNASESTAVRSEASSSRPPLSRKVSPRTKSSSTRQGKTSGLTQMQILCLLIGISLIPLKALFAFMYHSTDFEVHRNWLAITFSTPLAQWYFEDTSPWTLDYPPFFAYFERALAQVAVLVDPRIVEVESLDYKSTETILFQRGSVILTDCLLVYAAYRCISGPVTKLVPPGVRLAVFLLMVFNVGLFIVDHIHFQYNGILLGVLLLTCDSIQRGQDERVTFYFSILVLMKHLFATMAPVLAVYLLKRSLDLSIDTQTFSLSFVKCAYLLSRHALIATICVATAFGPFLHAGGFSQLTQIASRLFPFSRGLVHAYWAPNVWALYCAIDKVLFLAAPRFPELQPYLQQLRVLSGASDAKANALPNSTSGLVGDFAFHFLPRITAQHCLLLVLLSQSPAWLRILFQSSNTVSKQRWRHEQYVVAVRSLVFASLCAFMLGYHVHEKAIIIPWVLQTLLIAESPRDRVLFLLFSAAGSVSLFPLIPGAFEGIVKTLLTLVFIQLAWYLLDMVFAPESLRRGVTACFLLLGVAALYSEVLHFVIFDDDVLPFLPLMVTSCLCALVLLTCWAMSFSLLLYSS